MVLAVLAAWGACMLSAGIASAQSVPAEKVTPTTKPPAPRIIVSPGAPGTGTAPAQPPAQKPGTGTPPPQPGEQKGVCDQGPVVTRVACESLGDVAGNLTNGNVGAIPGDVAGNLTGGAVGVMQESMASALTKWVVDGTSWLIDQLGDLLDSSTTPQIDEDWFGSHYRTMAAMAAVVALPLLLVSLIGALIHQDGGRLVRTVVGQLPLAGILTGAGVALVGLALTATDAMSAWVTQGAGGNAAEILGRSAAALRTVSTQDGGLFPAFLGGLLLAASAVMVWLWLLLRSAAIYVAVLFLPLAVAGLVWPETAHWAKRLAHLLVALILSKFVIAAILSLATAGAGAGADSGFGAVLAGVVLLALAAISPLALLKLTPILEAGAVSVATSRRSAGGPVGAASAGGGQWLLRQANSWKAMDDAGPAPRGWAGGGGATPGSALGNVVNTGTGLARNVTAAGGAVMASAARALVPEGTSAPAPSPPVPAEPPRPARHRAPEGPLRSSEV